MRLPLILIGLMALSAMALGWGSDAAQVQGSAGYNVYNSSDGVSVNSPEANVGVTLDQRTVLSMNYGLDAVSAASFNYAQSKTHQGQVDQGSCQDCHKSSVRPDALSGASLNYGETRQFLTLAAERHISEARAKVSWYHSQEHDYSSNAVHASWSQDLAGRDTNLTAEFGHNDDWVSSTVNPGFGAGRYDDEGSLALTQLLDPHSELRVLADFASNRGYLADPYAWVFTNIPNPEGEDGLNGTPRPATAPDLRQRWDLGLTYKRSLPWESAMEAGWRLYHDSWDVTANSLDLSWAKEISTGLGTWVLEPEYRYYTQTEAYFFQNVYSTYGLAGGYTGYITRDLKLAAYSSHWLGLDLRGPLSDLFSAELRYGHYVRVDSLDYSHYFAGGPASADTLQFILSLQ